MLLFGGRLLMILTGIALGIGVAEAADKARFSHSDWDQERLATAARVGARVEALWQEDFKEPHGGLRPRALSAAAAGLQAETLCLRLLAYDPSDQAQQESFCKDAVQFIGLASGFANESAFVDVIRPDNGTFTAFFRADPGTTGFERCLTFGTPYFSATLIRQLVMTAHEVEHALDFRAHCHKYKGRLPHNATAVGQLDDKDYEKNCFRIEQDVEKRAVETVMKLLGPLPESVLVTSREYILGKAIQEHVSRKYPRVKGAAFHALLLGYFKEAVKTKALRLDPDAEWHQQLSDADRQFLFAPDLPVSTSAAATDKGLAAIVTAVKDWFQALVTAVGWGPRAREIDAQKLVSRVTKELAQLGREAAADWKQCRAQSSSRTGVIEGGPRGTTMARLLRARAGMGGILFGTAADPRSVRIRSARIEDRDGQAVLAVTCDAESGPQVATYSCGSITELWSAYHILRPTDWMRAAAGVVPGECQLVNGEGGGATTNARFALHPALACTALGERMMDLEARSGHVFFHAPDGGPLKEQVTTLQWYDAPAVIRVAAGRLLVEPAEGPPFALLRLRLVGPEERPPQTPAATARPGGRGSDRMDPALVARIFVRAWRENRAYLTRTDWQSLARDEVDRSSGSQFKDYPVDQEQALNRTRRACPAVVWVDRFARTLALLTWIESQTGALPEWPATLQPSLCAVRRFRTPDEAVPPLVLTPCAPLPPSPDGVGPVQETSFVLECDGKRCGYQQLRLQSVQRGATTCRLAAARTVQHCLWAGSRLVRVTESELEWGPDGRLRRAVARRLVNDRLEETRSGRVNGDRLEVELQRAGLPPASWSVPWEGRAVVFSAALTGLLEFGAPAAPGFPGGPGLCWESGDRLPLRLERNQSNGRTLLELVHGQRTWRMQFDASGQLLHARGSWLPDNLERKLVQVPASVLNDLCWVEPLPITSLGTFRPLTGKLPDLQDVGRLRLRLQLASPLEPGQLPVPDPSWSEVARVDSRTIDIENRVPLLPSGPGLTALPNDGADPKRYLQETPLVDFLDERVRQHVKAARTRYPVKYPLHKLTVLEYYAMTEVRFTTLRQARKASEVARLCQGCCAEHSMLLAALLRCEGIPARLVCGCVVVPEDERLVLHQWVEAWLDGVWYRLDSALAGSDRPMIYLKFGELEGEPGYVRRIALDRAEVVKVVRVEDEGRAAAVAPPRLSGAAQLEPALARAAFQLGKAQAEALGSFMNSGNLAETQPTWEVRNALARKLHVPLSGPFFALEGNEILDEPNCILYLRNLPTGQEATFLRQRYGAAVAAAYLAPLMIDLTLRVARVIHQEGAQKEARQLLRATCLTAKVPEERWQPFLALLERGGADSAATAAARAWLLEQFAEHWHSATTPGSLPALGEP